MKSKKDNTVRNVQIITQKKHRKRTYRYPYHTNTWTLTFLDWCRNFNKKWEC